MSSTRGLPENRRMRHDTHFVEELTSERHGSIGRLIEIESIEPNPHQPRKQFGDLSDLVRSIKEKGVLEPILVRAQGKGYQIIAGERRYQASLLAGLSQLPCVEIDVDNRGSLEISLIENLQRKDLTPFEEAAALGRLCEQFGYTHEQVARKLGKSRNSITEILSLNRMPERIQDLCRQADIGSRSMLLEIVRQRNAEEMEHLIERISDGSLRREEVRDLKREIGRRKTSRKRNFVFRYQAPQRDFSLQIRFKKQDVERDELIEILSELLRNLRDDGPADQATQAARTPARRSASGTARPSVEA